MANTWWVWMAAALVLGSLEMLLPGYILLGFAVGAFVMSLGFLVGLFTETGLPALLGIFAVISLVAWIVLLKFFKRPGSDPKTFEHDINDTSRKS